ncbi:hypothetical protein SEA_WEASELS2_69 [Rhodococcus phage Weasels2]|uniref:Uncharacterized protein n=1 Tax=Rhodococcus phage Weasels2 TaxID=1897437 RepID=A0A1I9SA52_9CAUD|nr:hypothetical protein FDH04_gp069 [Rhodococcus phage Weasels2]AOZ63658.1 hypothetical protein SEA_WEASELS2_69 [Rhodococcus phage Weasels2]
MSLEDINNLPNEIPAKHEGHRTDHEIIHAGLKAIVEELANKQSKDLELYNMDGEVDTTVPLGEFVNGLYFAMLYSPNIQVEIPGYSRYIDRDYVIVEELPANPRIGAMYLLRAPDGSITWHLPEMFPPENV